MHFCLFDIDGTLLNSGGAGQAAMEAALESMFGANDPVHGIATTPEDDLILATAVSGNATHLVTGDRQLQNVGEYRGIKVLRAREFLSRL